MSTDLRHHRNQTASQRVHAMASEKQRRKERSVDRNSSIRSIRRLPRTETAATAAWTWDVRLRNAKRPSGTGPSIRIRQKSWLRRPEGNRRCHHRRPNDHLVHRTPLAAASSAKAPRRCESPKQAGPVEPCRLSPGSPGKASGRLSASKHQLTTGSALFGPSEGDSTL